MRLDSIEARVMQARKPSSQSTMWAPSAAASTCAVSTTCGNSS